MGSRWVNQDKPKSIHIKRPVCRSDMCISWGSLWMLCLHLNPLSPFSWQEVLFMAADAMRKCLCPPWRHGVPQSGRGKGMLPVCTERWPAALSSAAPPSRAALPPIFDVQPRHLVKIAQIARQHQGLVLQGNRRNFQIHRPDPYTLLPQLGKGGGRALIKREHLPRRKEAHQAQQALIVRHLPCD